MMPLPVVIIIIVIVLLFAITIITLFFITVVRAMLYHKKTRSLGVRLLINSLGLPSSAIFSLWKASLISESEYDSRFRQLFSSTQLERKGNKEISASYEKLKLTYKLYFRALSVFLY